MVKSNLFESPPEKYSEFMAIARIAGFNHAIRSDQKTKNIAHFKLLTALHTFIDKYGVFCAFFVKKISLRFLLLIFLFIQYFYLIFFQERQNMNVLYMDCFSIRWFGVRW